MNVTTQTDVGKKKATNEDTVMATSYGSTHLLVVADGMGGHAAGDVASELAVSTISEFVSTALNEDRTDYEAILGDAISEANVEICEHADSSNIASMGTTVVATIYSEDELIIANVGDSRAYSVGETITQLTVDHSLVQELVEEGEITAEEAETHPQRNVLSQALGNASSVDPDFYKPSVEEILLLCSDGLTEEVAEERIIETIHTANSLSTAADELISLANQNGGSDNISVVLSTT